MINTNGTKEIAKLLSESLKVRTSHYIIGAGSLVVALAWNEAIKNGIKQVYPIEDDGLKAAFVYAAILTLILVLIIYLLPDTKDLLPKETQEKLEHLKDNAI